MNKKIPVRPKKILQLGVALISCILYSNRSFAEIGIKKLFLQNCAKAKESVHALTPEEKPEIVRFLSLLLKRRPVPLEQAQPLPPQNPPLKSNPFESPLDESTSGELFQFFDPGRETDAKLCALETLYDLTPDSFSAVPSILDISTEISMPFSVREQIAPTIIHIVSKSTSVSAEDFQSVGRRVIESFISGNRRLAENVMIELGERIVPLLIEEFKRPDPARRTRIQNLLVAIDRHGEFVPQAVTPLITSGESNLRIKAIEIIEKTQTKGRVINSALIASLRDISTEVQEASLRALTKLFQTVTADESTQREAFRATVELLRERPESLRPAPQQLLSILLPKNPALQSELTPLLLLPDDLLQIRVLELLNQNGIELSEDSSNRVITLLPRLSEKGTLIAIGALRHTKVQKKVVDDLTKFITPKDKRVPGIERISLEALRTLSYLSSVDANSQRLIPLAISLLPSNKDVDDVFLTTHPTALFLKRFSKEALVPLTKMATRKDSYQAVGSLRLLTAIAPDKKETIDAALAVLKQTEDDLVRNAAEDLLINTGPKVQSNVEQLIKSKNRLTRFSAAKILASVNPKNQSVLPILLEDLPAKGCGDIERGIGLISKLQNGVPLPLLSKLIECTRRFEISLDHFGGAIRMLPPLSNEGKMLLLNLLPNPEVNKFLKLKIIELAGPVKLPPIELTSMLLDFAAAEDSSLALVSLDAIKSLGSAASVAHEKVMELSKNQHLELVVRNEAAFVTAALAPQNDDYVDFFVKELKGEDADWALKTIARLEPLQMSRVLSQSYDSVTGENKKYVIRLIADLPGEAAMPFIDKLLNVLSSTKNQETKFETLVTLLKINPTRAELVTPIRQALVDVNREELVSQKLTPAALPLLEDVRARAESRLEKIGASSLIESIGPRT